jgi:ankyrin repeat protein
LQQNGIDVNAIDNEKTTPLHIAVKNNKKEAVELLLEKETINITLSDTKQLTPLDIAVQQSSAEITLLLLRKIKEKGLKISDATYEKINQKSNLRSNDEILGLANKLKQNAIPAN